MRESYRVAAPLARDPTNAAKATDVTTPTTKIAKFLY